MRLRLLSVVLFFLEVLLCFYFPKCLGGWGGSYTAFKALFGTFLFLGCCSSVATQSLHYPKTINTHSLDDIVNG